MVTPALENIQALHLTTPGGKGNWEDPSLPRLPQGSSEHVTRGRGFSRDRKCTGHHLDSSRILVEGP